MGGSFLGFFFLDDTMSDGEEVSDVKAVLAANTFGGDKRGPSTSSRYSDKLG
jgi:hypothetical protein